jgi:glutathione synthase/RimK-type ligase-like ATP-grasp enzyme
MKTIVIFCRTLSSTHGTFSDPYYWNSYQDLVLLLQAKGATAYLATDPATYMGDGVFSTVYAITEKVTVEDFKPVHNVKADLVYDKGGFEATDVPVLNPPYVRKITTSKSEMYKHFPQYQPQSIICNNEAELISSTTTLNPDNGLVVAKELTGDGGKAVFIGTNEEVLAKAKAATYPLIAQEFVDTSGGIPGYIEGMHDLRIMIGGGNVWSGKFRWPKQGDYRANVGQGGGERYLSVDEIPPEAIALAKEIDSYFKDYDRYIAADFALTTKGWKLIELNSKPGLTPADFSDISRHTLECLADYLIEIA